MKFRWTIAAALVAALTVAATAGLAQQDPIAARKALMKRNGQLGFQADKMARGQEPFDLAKAKAMFQSFEEAAAKMPNLYPDNTRTGGETRATPKVWEDMADFKARLAKFGADAKAAEASATDLESFKAAFGPLAKECDSCHEIYRAPRR